MADVAASVLARLQNKAKETGRSYQLCLQLFCQEEFLRRVARSKYADNLVLKGGLFIYTLTGFESRATVDVDFLLREMANTEADVLRMVEEIALIDTGNDFLSFHIKSINPIAMQRKYNGLSVAIIGSIKNTKTPFNIDFGVGDIVVPKPEKRMIPTQLEDFIAPQINTYSIESTIAEKFDAIITRFEFTSRMKDFYDIYYLAHAFDFDGRRLQEAVFETLQNRQTSYDADTLDNLNALSSNTVMRTRWNAFLKKIRATKLEFKDVVDLIKTFLEPIFVAIVREQEFLGQWDCKKRDWTILNRLNFDNSKH